MLFRWFVGLAMDDAVWDHSTFSKNHERLLVHDVIVSLFNETVETATAVSERAETVVAEAAPESVVSESETSDNTENKGDATV